MTYHGEPGSSRNILVYCAAAGLAILAGAALYIGLQARAERQAADREATDRMALHPTPAAATTPARPAPGAPAPNPTKVLVPGAIPVLVNTWTARMPTTLRFNDGHGEADLGTSKATATVAGVVHVDAGALPTRIDCTVRGAGLAEADLYFLKACVNAVYAMEDTDGYAVRGWADQTVHPATTPATRHEYHCADITVTTLVDSDAAELSILPGDPNRTTCVETTG